jgi:hypothetical protein
VSRPVATVLGRVVRFLGSFGLAVTLLLVLLLLTFLGTLEQAHMSLFDVQKKYFESLVLFVDAGPVSIPFPGASLVMGLLSLNLIVGGIIRIKKGWRTAWILVTHVGVLMLFAGGLVEALESDKGHLTLHEGESSDQFQSYFEWELAVRERKPDGSATELVVESDELMGLDPGDVLRAKHASLPFDVVLSGWVRNAEPRRGDRGWVARALDPEMEAERNLPAVTVSLTPSQGAPVRSLVWGGEVKPWAVEVAGRVFEVDLRRRRWTMPFAIELREFVHEKHPGTSMPSRFSSYVTQTENGVETDRHITMNEPLRDRGYTLYQSGYGPKEGPGRVFSTFSVVQNPTDRVPWIAFVVMCVGLVVHFAMKLLRHLEAQAHVQRAAARPPGAST